MRKSLLFLPLALLTGLTLQAQEQLKNSGIPIIPQNGIEEHATAPARSGSSSTSQKPTPKAPIKRSTTHPTTQSTPINIVPVGTESNALGTIGNRQFLWADQSIHSITLTHRNLYGSNTGAINYDVSKLSGHAGSWLTNKLVYAPDGDPQGPHFSTGRYPQGVIYSPFGNTIADSALEVFFCPTRDASNPDSTSNPVGDWGGHGFGSQHLAGMDTMQRQIHSNRPAGLDYFIPDGMFITKHGVVYNLDESSPGKNGYHLIDTLVLSKGVIDTVTKHFSFTMTKVPFHTLKTPVTGYPMFSDCKIVFADDGMTGYISATARQSYTSTVDSSAFQLVVTKTTDGGSTWSTPISIDVNQANPFLMNDTSVRYGAGFEHDVVVDANNNLHIVVNINMWNITSTPQVSFTYFAAYQPGMLGIFDVYTPDGGLTWKFRLIGRPNLFEGTYGISGSTVVANTPIGEYNRPQASRTYSNGNKVFFTYFDTDTTSGVNAASSGNISPDAWCIGYDVQSKLWTAPKNFTTGSAAEGQVRQGMTSYYVFDSTAGSAGIYTIPVAYVGFANDDPTQSGVPEQLNYIDGISFQDSDFNDSTNGSSLGVPVLAGYQNSAMMVSQNYPNPFSTLTNIDVTLVKGGDLTLQITNLLGQVVYTQQNKALIAGPHTLSFDGSSLSSGIYFYTLRTNDAALTRKMSVK